MCGRKGKDEGDARENRLQEKKMKYDSKEAETANLQKENEKFKKDLQEKKITLIEGKLEICI